jgi:hypothetical protein
VFKAGKFSLKVVRRWARLTATQDSTVEWKELGVKSDGIAVCSKPATRSIEVRGNATRDAGVGTRVTGRRSVSSRSIRSATLTFRRRAPKSSFPVRLASLLSRPDLATPRPRSTTEEMGGAEQRAAHLIARGWRAPHLLRSEHHGTLTTRWRCAPPDTEIDSSAATTIDLSSQNPGDNYLDTHRHFLARRE